MSTPRARTALRRNILIAACAVGLVVVVGLVAEWRDAARTPPAEQQAKLAAVQQQRMPEGATEGSSAYPSPAPAPGWIRQPRSLWSLRWSSHGSRSRACRSTCRPAPPSARPSAISTGGSASRNGFRPRTARRRIGNSCATSEITESGAPEARTRKTSVQFLREQQAAAPSPVNAETMRRSCES